MEQNRKRKIVVGITGASATLLAINLLKTLEKNKEIETHVVVSESAKKVMTVENIDIKEIKKTADLYYENNDMAAPIASGSFLYDGLVIIPCSMNTLSEITTGSAQNLITRVASVAIKERRKIILVVRETPLSSIHLENMLKVTNAGAIIFPPNIALYYKPKTIDDVIQHFTGRILDLLRIESDMKWRWS